MQVTDSEVLVVFPRVRMLVVRGEDVVLDLPEGLSPDDVSHLLYGWAARIALTQRGVVVVHASVVSRDGVAVALAGRPAAGKTTTAMALRRRGWSLVCDDVAALRAGAGSLEVLPFGRPVHLTDEAAARLGLDPGAGVPLPDRGKARHEVQVQARPARLDAFVELVPQLPPSGAAPSTGVAAERLTGGAAFETVRRHTRFQGLAERPPRTAAYVERVAQIAALPVWRISRGAGIETVALVADAVEDLRGGDR